MKVMRGFPTVPIAAIAALATGCVTALPVERPAIQVPIPPAWTAVDVAPGEVYPDWWADFGDDALSAAIETVKLNKGSLHRTPILLFVAAETRYRRLPSGST